MNTPVSFELAKLLKEKGFDENSKKCYAQERLINKNTGGDIFTDIYRLCDKSRFHKKYFSAPTIAEVVMWLYEKHGIWINVRPYDKNKWYYTIIDVADNGQKAESKFTSPTEAYEAAIEYTLKNFIL